MTYYQNLVAVLIVGATIFFCGVELGKFVLKEEIKSVIRMSKDA